MQQLIYTDTLKFYQVNYVFIVVTKWYYITVVLLKTEYLKQYIKSYLFLLLCYQILRFS